MNDPVLITAPATEPVTLAEMKLQLGFGPVEDSTRESAAILNEKLRRFILSARREAEAYCRRAFITQRWILRMFGFPGKDWRYNWNGYPAIPLAMPPFQSVDFVKYVDTFGNVQDLPVDTTYGNNAPQYGYQLYRGSDVAPAVIYSSWARPWPPTRMVPSNVMIQFRCGYGQPITASMTSGSAVLTTSSMTFNPDDAPLMTGDTGLPISVPGAGASGAPLNSFIASVDANGQATLKDAAQTSVTNVAGYAGQPVPEEIRNAIKLIAECYYNEGSEGGEMPAAAERMLAYYRNLTA